MKPHSRRCRIVALGAAAAAALAAAGAALAGGGFPGFGPFGPGGPGPGGQTAVLNDAAGNLGVSPAALRKAIREALKAQVERQVRDGVLTATQGAAAKEAIDSGSAGVTLGRGAAGLERLDVLEAAAAYLGLTPAALHDRLGAGDSLADVAEAEGKDVAGLQDALVARAASVLAAAVAAGDLTDARRDAALARIRGSVDELVAGAGRGFGFEGRGGHGFHHR